jgi:hypothetical protein
MFNELNQTNKHKGTKVARNLRLADSDHPQAASISSRKLPIHFELQLPPFLQAMFKFLKHGSHRPEPPQVAAAWQQH